MTYREPLSQKAVGLSISESDEMAQLGLAEEHLRDAMGEVTRHLLALGARLIYGGDLRQHGFTELLFELAARHHRDADTGDVRPAVVSYLAWPIHRQMGAIAVRELRERLYGLAEVRCVDIDGNVLDALALSDASIALPAGDARWAASLSACRRVMTEACDARIVVGGRTSNFLGSMPGIAEEVLGSLQHRQPLFLVGGFGGCARDIAAKMHLLPKAAASEIAWKGHDEFGHFDVGALENGLTLEENITLATTVHVDEAVALVLRGLLRRFGTFRS